MNNLKYEVETKKSFDEAVLSIQRSLEEQKFGVLWKLNFKDKLKEKGISFESNFTILEVCNPHKAKEVLGKHIDVGYFLPCKVVVYEDQESVKIGTINPEMLINMLEYSDLRDTAAEVEKILITAINNAL
ncbi:MAG TPA: DUF302 domain-containing protein [Syntrophomonadaceae bacterium]|nr:DUF302 domain-containing protein [Syntrophomonadaceae bacterium]